MWDFVFLGQGRNYCDVWIFNILPKFERKSTRGKSSIIVEFRQTIEKIITGESSIFNIIRQNIENITRGKSSIFDIVRQMLKNHKGLVQHFGQIVKKITRCKFVIFITFCQNTEKKFTGGLVQHLYQIAAKYWKLTSGQSSIFITFRPNYENSHKGLVQHFHQFCLKKKLQGVSPKV